RARVGAAVGVGQRAGGAVVRRRHRGEAGQRVEVVEEGAPVVGDLYLGVAATRRNQALRRLDASRVDPGRQVLEDPVGVAVVDRDVPDRALDAGALRARGVDRPGQRVDRDVRLAVGVDRVDDPWYAEDRRGWVDRRGGPGQ